MKRRHRILSAASVASLLLSGFSISYAETTPYEVGNVETITLDKDLIHENEHIDIQQPSELKDKSGLAWGDGAAGKVTIDGENYNVDLKGNQAGIYVAGDKDLTINAKSINLEATADKQLVGMVPAPVPVGAPPEMKPGAVPAAGVYSESNVTLKGTDGITVSGYNHGILATNMNDGSQNVGSKKLVVKDENGEIVAIKENGQWIPQKQPGEKVHFFKKELTIGNIDTQHGFIEFRLPDDDRDTPPFVEFDRLATSDTPTGMDSNKRTTVALNTKGTNIVTATGNSPELKLPFDTLTNVSGIAGISSHLTADVTLTAGVDNIVKVDPKSDHELSSGISLGNFGQGADRNGSVGVVTLKANRNNVIEGATYGIRGFGMGGAGFEVVRGDPGNQGYTVEPCDPNFPGGGMIEPGDYGGFVMVNAVGQPDIPVNPDTPVDPNTPASYIGGTVILDAGKDNTITAHKVGINMFFGMSVEMKADGTNTITVEKDSQANPLIKTGAQISGQSNLSITGSTKVDAPIYGIVTRQESKTVIDGKGGIFAVTTDQESAMTEIDARDPDGNQVKLRRELAKPLAVTSLSGSTTTIENASLDITSPIAFLAAHPKNGFMQDGGSKLDPYMYDLKDDYSDQGSQGGGFNDDGGSYSLMAVRTTRVSLPDEDPYDQGNPTVPILDPNAKGAELTVTYGKDSKVKGDILAYDKGTVTLKPTADGSINLEGNLQSFGEDSSSAGENFGNITRYQPLPTMNNHIIYKGGTIDLTLDHGSIFKGTTDNGIRELRLMNRGMAGQDEGGNPSVNPGVDPGEMPAPSDEYFRIMREEPVSGNQGGRDPVITTEIASGTINFTLNGGSTWNMTGSSIVTSLSGNNGVVYFKDGGDALEAGKVSGSNTFAMDLDAKDGKKSDMLYINEGTSDKQTLVIKNVKDLDGQMKDGEAVRFATINNPGKGFGDGTTVAKVASGIYNSTFKTEYRKVQGDKLNTDAYNADRNGGATYKDGLPPMPDYSLPSGNQSNGSQPVNRMARIAADSDSASNTNMPAPSEKDWPLNPKPGTELVKSLYASSDSAANIYVVKSADVNDGAKVPSRLSDLSYRYFTDLDTFTNRSGNTQYFTEGATDGAWIRLRYRNLGVDGIGELNGNTYELGYTTILSDELAHQHRFSASFSYTKNNGNPEDMAGTTHLRDTAISLYDTHVYNADGKRSYWDNYFKYHYGREEYDIRDGVTGTNYNANYHSHNFNLSTEYGWEQNWKNGLTFVPQAQMQLSYLGGYDATDSQGLSLSQDHAWSLIGRVGFDLVKHLDDEGNKKFYFKASLIHEFLDGQDTNTTFGLDTYTVDGNHKGTWGVVGIGYSVKTGKDQSMYFDLERYIGNDYSRTYNIRAGLNWKF